MWTRRKFLGDSLYLSGGVIFAAPMGNSLFSPNRKVRKLTILHTNDTHSHIDPFPKDDAKYPGRGGVSQRGVLINKIREEEKNVLLLDAGDIFQGTPYFNRYNGILEMKVMQALGYDAVTMGNHDFDAGMQGFKTAKGFANFPFLCANYDFSNTILKEETKPYHIFVKDGIKIGVFGLGVELDGLVPKKKYEDTVYLDPIAKAQEQVDLLQKKKCDLIVCLSHLGYDYEDKTKASDHKLAQNTKGIHLIIGGHTHTFLPKPTVLKNSEGDNVLVNQVGWAGVNLGRVDFVFEKGIHSEGGLIEVS
jgi:5'-nucleotidase